MSSCSFYECKECEIYLDLGCALLNNIVTCWDLREMLHYSHKHLLRRCRPGPDARGSCILCELPHFPSSICYGCVYCYPFFHERCLDLLTEIRHPVHPEHLLRLIDYIRSGGRTVCNACRDQIYSVPFSCLECRFDIHMRCPDSLLRGLMHKSHEHILFYVSPNAKHLVRGDNPCQICNGTASNTLGFYYHCIKCVLEFHFECLGIPKSIFKRSCHVHPLVCKIIPQEDDSLEYCGVCQTMVHAGHHVYSCQECDFLGHIECILREVNDIRHIHVMKDVDMCEIRQEENCDICKTDILGNPWKCETCSFQRHNFCAELGKPSRHRCHWNHTLTLLPKPLARDMMSCDSCREDIKGFNMFCRTCSFVIHVSCVIKGKRFLGC